MLSGVALMVFGAGLILTNPIARRYMGQLGVGDLASLALAGSGSLLEIAGHVEAVVDVKVRSRSEGRISDCRQ